MGIDRRSVVTGAVDALGAAALGPRRALAADPIRIGVSLPLSGNAEIIGTRQKLGIEIARDQLNAAGGVLGRQIELVFRDDKGSPEQCLAGARDFASSGVNLIIGASLSGQNIALIGIVQSLNAVMMTPSSPLDSLTHELFNRNFFRLTDSSLQRDRAMARIVAERYPDVTQWGAIISDISIGHDAWKQFSAGLREYYPKYARKDPVITEAVTAKFGSTDFKTQIFRVMQSPVEGIMNYTFGSDMVTLWKQAKTLGLTDKLKVVADGGSETEFAQLLGKDAPPNAWGAVAWYFGNNSTNKISADLVDEVAKRTGDKYPAALTGGGHSAVLAYAAAIKAANSTQTDAVIDALEKISFDTAKGTLRFRKEDHQQIGPVIVVSSGGTATGFEFKEYVQYPGEELAGPATPGVALKM